jgi:hypothetical protein
MNKMNFIDFEESPVRDCYLKMVEDFLDEFYLGLLLIRQVA